VQLRLSFPGFSRGVGNGPIISMLALSTSINDDRRYSKGYIEMENKAVVRGGLKKYRTIVL
jgi:hypothetical protein